MATVTKKFRDDFEVWAKKKVADSEWTLDEVEGLKAILRADFSPGNDLLRTSQVVIGANCVEIPAAINDHEERYRLWADFFAAEVRAFNHETHKPTNEDQ